MKKLFLNLILAFVTLLSVAQNKKSINSDHGVLTVGTNPQSLKDYIEFSMVEWNTMMQGTDYTVEENSFSVTITICITIASRRKNCASGIGFRCGFAICPPSMEAKQVNSNGQKNDRVYSASYTKNGNTVILEFNEKVDWDWLAN